MERPTYACPRRKVTSCITRSSGRALLRRWWSIRGRRTVRGSRNLFSISHSVTPIGWISMFNNTRNSWYVLGAVLAAACGCLQAQPGSGNEAAVRAMGAIPLKDYAPDSSLLVPEHHPSKARYAAIDVHSHAYEKTSQEVASWVRTMDE